MTKEEPLALHRSISAFMAEAARMENLQPELARARRDFFGAADADHDPLRQLAAESRFAEWYLIERFSEVLGEEPLRKLARGMVDAPHTDALLRSTVSVFVVEGGEELVRLRDLQSRDVLDMHRLPMLDLSTGPPRHRDPVAGGRGQGWR